MAVSTQGGRDGLKREMYWGGTRRMLWVDCWRPSQIHVLSPPPPQ